MNQGQLIKEVSQVLNVPNRTAKNLVEDVVEVIGLALLRGEDVTIPKIGKLKVVTRAQRTGRNPSTGASLQIPSHRVVKFTHSAKFKEVLNEV